MKKLLLIIAIVLLAACVVSLLYAALNLHAYHHLMDGSPEHYARLHGKAITFFAVGFGLAALGALCLILRTKG